MPTTQFNQWATWPWTLYALSKTKSFQFDSKMQNLIDEIMGIDIAFLPNGSPVTLEELLETINNKYSATKHSFDVFKAMDLGGGDQLKIEKGTKTIADFSNGVYLITAHENATRITNAGKLTALAREHAKTDAEFRKKMPLYFALNIKYETFFTGLSVYTHVTQSKIPTILLPIGSTDAHLVYYTSTGDMLYNCHCDWKSDKKSIQVKLAKLLDGNIPEKLILGGSYMFGLNYEKLTDDSFSKAWGTIPGADLDAKNKTFSQIGFLTGGILTRFLMTENAHALWVNWGRTTYKGKFFNCESIVKEGDKGKDLCELLECVTGTNENIYRAFPNIQLRGCPRKIPRNDLSVDELVSIITAFSKNHQ